MCVALWIRHNASREARHSPGGALTPKPIRTSQFRKCANIRVSIRAPAVKKLIPKMLFEYLQWVGRLGYSAEAECFSGRSKRLRAYREPFPDAYCNPAGRQNINISDSSCAQTFQNLLPKISFETIRWVRRIGRPSGEGACVAKLLMFRAKHLTLTRAPTRRRHRELRQYKHAQMLSSALKPYSRNHMVFPTWARWVEAFVSRGASRQVPASMLRAAANPPLDLLNLENSEVAHSML